MYKGKKLDFRTRPGLGTFSHTWRIDRYTYIERRGSLLFARFFCPRKRKKMKRGAIPNNNKLYPEKAGRGRGIKH